MIEDVSVIRAGRLPFGALATLSAEDALAILRRRWATLVLSTLLGATAFYGAAALIPPSYVASAEIFVDPRTIQALDNATKPADSNADLMFVESQAHIIGSQSVLSRVVAGQKLDEDPEFAGGTADRTPLAALTDKVSVRRPERTFVLEVSVRARSAEKAARLANAVAQAYFDEQAAAHAGMARRAHQSLTDRLDALRDRVRQAEERADTFRRGHGLVGTRTTLVSEQQLTDATTQLAQARSRVIAAQSRLDEVKRMGQPTDASGAAPEAMVSPTVTLLRGQQADARRRLDKALAQLGPLHPAVRDAASEVDGANRAVGAELARIAGSARIELQRATATETAQQKVVADLSERASNASAAITQLGEFDREVDVNKNLLNTFLSRARETSELEQLDTGDARLITTAQPPHARSFPPRGSLFAAAGGLLGLAGGLALVLLRGLPGIAASGPLAAPVPTPAPAPVPVPTPVPVPVRDREPFRAVAAAGPRIRRLADYRP